MKQKRLEDKNEQNISDLWTSSGPTCLIRITEGKKKESQKERKRGQKKIFEEITLEFFFQI